MARSPSDITGLMRWSRADDYSATGDGNSFTSGSVTDRANAGTSWAPGTAGSGPTYWTSVAALGGRPALEFDGLYTDAVAELNTTTLLSATNGYTVWAVHARAATGGGTAPALVSQDTIANPNRVFQLGFSTGTPSQGRMVAFTNSTATARTDPGTTLAAKTTPAVFTGTADTTMTEQWTNGASAGPTTTPTGLYAIAGRVIVGATESTNTTYPFAGHIAEWGIYDHVLTATERQLLHSYVQDRYAITVTDYVADAPATPAGTAAGTWTFTGTAAGQSARAGTAAGSWSFAGAANGSAPTGLAQGSAAGTWTFTGTAAGTSARSGAAVGAWSFTGTAAGSAPGGAPPGVNGIPNQTTTSVATTTTTAGTPVHKYVVTIGTDAASFWVPDTVLNATHLTVVLTAHGAGGTRTWADADTGAQGILRQRLLDAGYAVLSQTLHGDQFGNSIAQADLAAGQAWVEGITGWTVDHVLLWGESMGGGAIAAAYARKTVPTVRAIFLAAPLLDYTYEPPNVDPALKSGLYSAYGVASDGSDLATKTAGYSPMSRAAADYTALRVFISSSSADTTVPQTQNAAAWITKIAPVAANISDYRTTGGHVSAQHYPQTSVVSYFQEAITIAEGAAGSASGTWSYIGAATGTSTRSGIGAGTFTFTGTATGTAPGAITLTPLTGPTSAAFTSDGATFAAFTSDGVGAATFAY